MFGSACFFLQFHKYNLPINIRSFNKGHFDIVIPIITFRKHNREIPLLLLNNTVQHFPTTYLSANSKRESDIMFPVQSCKKYICHAGDIQF